MVMVTVVVMEVVMVMVIGPNGESTWSGDDDVDDVQHSSTRDKILTLDEYFCFRFHQLRKQSDLVLIRSVQVQFLKKKNIGRVQILYSSQYFDDDDVGGEHDDDHIYDDGLV